MLIFEDRAVPAFMLMFRRELPLASTVLKFSEGVDFE
jgi:hypothetical protein